MSTKIIPTVGRVVWFYPATDTQTADFSPPAAGEPLAAIVAAVKSPDSVNLTVFDAMGFPHARLNVLLVQDGQDVPEGGFYATWMPYQIGQAKKAEDREHDAKQMADASPRRADNPSLRAHALDMALRTSGAQHYTEVVAAAKAYQAHIEGSVTPSARELAMEELLRSACAIADRKGAETAWERFANSIRELGLTGVTARTYRVLPSDEQ
jgi:hypothetical protein